MDIAGWHINAYLKGATMKKLFLALFLLPILGYAQISNFWLLKNNTLYPVLSTWKVGAGTTAFGTSAYTDSNYVNAKIIAGGGTIVKSMAFADSTSYHGSASIVTVGALTSGSIGAGFTNIDSARLANIVSKIISANTFLTSGNSGGNAKYLTIDTTKYATSAMSGFTSYIEKATWDAKQSAIANLADTSKYKKGYDSVASTGYASVYQVGLKQNLISNLADTSKYKKGYDSVASTGYASVYQVGLKQNKVLTGSQVYDFGVIAGGQDSSFTISVVGAVTGNPVLLSFSSMAATEIMYGVVYWAEVSSSDVVKVHATVLTGAAGANPPSRTYYVTVIKNQ